MNDTLPTLHEQTNNTLVRRLSDELLAMRSSVCDSSQAVKDDARKAFELSDAQRQADAGSDLTDCKDNDRSASNPINTYASSYK